jgi:hypothetical protein
MWWTNSVVPTNADRPPEEPVTPPPDEPGDYPWLLGGLLLIILIVALVYDWMT